MLRCNCCISVCCVLYTCTCEADLLEAEQAEDAVIELKLSAMALVHLVQDAHQLDASFRRVAAVNLVGSELMERPLPRTADPLVLTLRKPIRSPQAEIRDAALATLNMIHMIQRHCN